MEPKQSAATENKMKLVLFDIDGTLLNHDGALKYEMTTGTPDNRYYQALKKEFNIEPSMDFLRFSGTTDSNILWHTAEECGVSRAAFRQKFTATCQDLYDYFIGQVADGSLYQPIPEAVGLVSDLAAMPNIRLGVITGNIAMIGKWKLAKTGLADHFSFGLYGDEAEDRLKLAGLTFERARNICGISFKPQDITVVGDTVRDIHCGKSIGAYTIGVNTAGGALLELLRAENPDLSAASLGDPQVRAYFGLQS